MGRGRAWALRGCLAGSAILPGVACAQEAMYTQAATMPGPGSVIVRPQFSVNRYGANPVTGTSRTTEYEFAPTVQFGLVRDLSLTIEGQFGWESSHDDGSGDDEFDKGVRDLSAMLKWRFFREDTGGVDTLRAALIGGAKFASGDDHDYSSESFDPKIGGVVTLVRGRHGLNQDLVYTFNTGGTHASNLGGDGPDDALAFDTSYLFRISPEAFTQDSPGGLYATIEMNGLYETNGDTELRWSPGLMYEAWGWAFEVMSQFPLWHELTERPELDWSVGIGLRFRF